MDEVNEAEQAVTKAEAALAEAQAKAAFKDYPKYVSVDPSHIVRANGHISVPAFPNFHIDRDGHVTVCVDNAEDEAKAVGADTGGQVRA